MKCLRLERNNVHSSERERKSVKGVLFVKWKWKKRETTFVDFLFSVKDKSLSANCKRIGD